MNYFKIRDSSDNKHAILDSKSIIIANLIDDDSSTIINIFEWKEIRSIIAIDTTSSIHLCFRDQDIDGYEIPFDMNDYKLIKEQLLSNLMNTKISGYSLIKQIWGNIILVVVSSLFTAVTISNALALEAGETITVTGVGKKGLLGSLLSQVAYCLGSVWSFIVGGVIISYFIYLLYSAINNKKEGVCISLKKESLFRI